MARTEPGDGRELDSVARLVELSETAPMPRIDGERPPLVARPKSRQDHGDQRPEPATATSYSGTAQLPEVLDASFAVPFGGSGADPKPQTAPPLSRSPRHAGLAGVAVVALAGFGAWLLWPGSEGGSAGPLPQVPVTPSRTSSAPPAVATLTASPTLPPATGRVDHTTVRTTEEQREPVPTGAQAPQASSHDPVSEAVSSAVSSYLQQWSSRHQQPRPRHHG